MAWHFLYTNHLFPSACFEESNISFHTADRFGKVYKLRICAAFGGLPKHQQFKELRAGAEVRREHRGEDLGALHAAYLAMTKGGHFDDNFPGRCLPNVAQILVCTPGRLIDLLKMKACNMRRVTYLVRVLTWRFVRGGDASPYGLSV